MKTTPYRSVLLRGGSQDIFSYSLGSVRAIFVGYHGTVRDRSGLLRVFCDGSPCAAGVGIPWSCKRLDSGGTVKPRIPVHNTGRSLRSLLFGIANFA
jgi:hypothetical protein